MKKVRSQGHLKRGWMRYLRPAVLAIGYIQLNCQETESLFRLISQPYRHGSMIQSNNNYFSSKGEWLRDNALTTVLLDKLLHHVHVMNIRGESLTLERPAQNRRCDGAV